MRIRLAVPDELDDQDRKAALDAALESVTRTVTGLVRTGSVPPAAGEIKSKRVRWHPEPPGDEHFDLPDTIMKRGHGDCDDLAPWHAGSLRAAGIDPHARAFVKKSGPKRWHALVMRGDGSIEDPSAHAGMHSVSGSSVLGAGAPIQMPMAQDGRLCLAVCPSRDRRHPLVWFARCDVPDQLEPWDWSSMSAAQHPAHAALKAIKAIRTVAGDDMEEEDDARLAAVHDLLLGADPEEVEDALSDILGDDSAVDACMDDALHSVGFFGDLWKGITKPFTSAAQFVRHPSLANAAAFGFSPFTGQLDAMKGVYRTPGLRELAHLGVPLAAGAFGGPAGAAAGSMFNQYMDSQVAPPPGMLPGLPAGLPATATAAAAATTAAAASAAVGRRWPLGHEVLKVARPKSELGDIRTSARNVRLLRWLRRKPQPAKLVGETADGEEVSCVVSATGPAQWTDVLGVVRHCEVIKALDSKDNVLRRIELSPDDPELRAENEMEAALAGVAKQHGSVPIISVDIPKLVDNIARNMREVSSEAARQQSNATKDGFSAMTSIVNLCLGLLVRFEQRLEATELELDAARTPPAGEPTDPRADMAMKALQQAMGGSANGTSGMDPTKIMQLLQTLQSAQQPNGEHDDAG